MIHIVSLVALLLLHPVHETVAELEWNPQTGRMEVALRLDALDEQSLTKSTADEPEVSEIAVKYLAAHFQVGDQPNFSEESDKKLAKTYHWVGRKTEGAYVWWYFEIEPGKPERPKWIRQRMFFHRDERYTNRVIVLDRKPRLAVTLTAEKPIKSLDKPDDERNANETRTEPKS